MDPDKDVVLDVSSTSSDSEEEFVSPLTQLANTSTTTSGAFNQISIYFPCCLVYIKIYFRMISCRDSYACIAFSNLYNSVMKYLQGPPILL